MARERFAELRAGLFTLLTLIGFIAMVFILGSQKGYFKSQITIKAKFSNVYGLQAGAPVRFMGVGIGYVNDIFLPDELPCTGIVVSLRIDTSVKKNITTDSTATIKWLSYVTGDSYVEISSGPCHEPVVKDGDFIKSTEPVDYTAVIENSTSVIESFSNISKKLEEGNFVELLNSTLVSLNESLRAFQTGNGLLYSLMYDPKGKQLLENFAATSESLNESAKALQKGEGLLHSLIYDPKGKQVMEDLISTSESLKEIMAGVEKGEGTLGALIGDPAVYDNLKNLLGGTNRSFLLRSLIRKSVERGKEEGNYSK